MTADYLAGLAARALGVATVVRPRPAARFESPPFEEQDAASPAAPPDSPRGPAPERPGKTGQGRATPVERPPRDPVRAAGMPTAPPSPVEAELESPAGRDDATPPAHDAPRSLPAARPAAPARSATAPPPGMEREEATVRPATRRAAELPTPRSGTARREPPPVRVTIGRIEVRAVAPPPTPTQSAPQRPAPLSLDEYLELRRSGRR